MRFSSLQILDGITDAAHGANKYAREVEAAPQTVNVNLDNVPSNCIVIIDKSGCVFMNHDVNEYLAEFMETAPERNISVEVIEPVAA